MRAKWKNRNRHNKPRQCWKCGKWWLRAACQRLPNGLYECIECQKLKKAQKVTYIAPPRFDQVYAALKLDHLLDLMIDPRCRVGELGWTPLERAQREAGFREAVSGVLR